MPHRIFSNIFPSVIGINFGQFFSYLLVSVCCNIWRILLKAGNGLGMKIVGGRTIPGTRTVGAYVAAIYQGGVAEQLLGELQEGQYHILEFLNS